MKLRFTLTTATLAAASVGAALVAGAATPPGAAAPSAPAEIVIPQSAFVMPRTAADGKDPFFPRSQRVYKEFLPPRPGPTAAPVVIELRLNGISGTPGHRLAIINNRTFEAGEEGEVPAGTGHMKIKCVEINADSAVIMVGAQRRELRLRAGF